MYDSLKRKCKDRIAYFTKYEKCVKNDISKGIAIGSRMAYNNILDQLYRNEVYIKNHIKIS